MAGAKGRIIGVVVAVVLLAIGLAGVFVPSLGLAVATSPKGIVSFQTASLGGNEITLTDSSTVNNLPCVGPSGSCEPQYCALTLGFIHWGDGTLAIQPSAAAGTSTSGGGTYTHNYTAAGTYNVTDTWNVIEYGSPSLSSPPPPPKGDAPCESKGTYTATAQVTVPNGGTQTSSSVDPAFSYSGKGFNLTVTDMTTTINAIVQKVVFEFGLPGQIASGSLGFSTTHDYTSAANYNVTDAVYWNAPGSSAQQVSTVTTLVPVPPAGTSNAAVFPYVSVAKQGLAVWANDSSTYTGYPQISSDKISWGDGTSPTVAATIGLHATHKYAANGTYSISDAVAWSYNGTAYVSYANTSITVASGTSGSHNQTCTTNCGGNGGGTSGCAGASCSTTTNGFDLVTAALIGLGVAVLFVTLVVSINLPLRIVLGIVIVVIVAAVGFFVGGA